MRASQFLFATLKQTPSNADIISSQLMLRAGLIRKLASGLYTWLPMGLRVLQNVERIVREEMERVGALEVFMPMTQPAELWLESGRFDDFGPELLRFVDRHDRRFLLGPTHEEVITDIARNELQSYKQLPICFFQIQSKFRDEIRPRFGVMRAREFIMKDAYSFHLTKDSLDQTYHAMYAAYTQIFTRLGLEFRAVQADTGAIGGSSSHEFHVLAQSGEDAIVFSDGSDYAANIELAEAVETAQRPKPSKTPTQVSTPNMPTCEAVSAHLGVPLSQTVKTIIVKQPADQEGNQNFVALVLRGDHTLNAVKAEKLDQVAVPLTLASDDELAALGLPKGYIGVNLDMPVVVDRAAAVLADFVCGANTLDTHLSGVNWERDATITDVVDIRNVTEGDASPDGKGILHIKRGIEVGHIFKLGSKYTQSLKGIVSGENGKPVTMLMGCYGLGISRVVAAAIEQNYDERGIIWPTSLAPFQVAIVPMKSKDPQVNDIAEELYQLLKQKGISVLLDDRKERPGVKFADLELVGIPHRVVVSERNLAQDKFEYRWRKSQENELLTRDALYARLGL